MSLRARSNKTGIIRRLLMLSLVAPSYAHHVHTTVIAAARPFSCSLFLLFACPPVKVVDVTVANAAHTPCLLPLLTLHPSTHTTASHAAVITAAPSFLFSHPSSCYYSCSSHVPQCMWPLLSRRPRHAPLLHCYPLYPHPPRLPSLRPRRLLLLW